MYYSIYLKLIKLIIQSISCYHFICDGCFIHSQNGGENASKMKIHEDKTQLIFFCQIFSRAQKKVRLQGVGPLDGNLTFLWITQKLKTKEKVLFIIHVKNNTVALYRVMIISIHIQIEYNDKIKEMNKNKDTVLKN